MTRADVAWTVGYLLLQVFAWAWLWVPTLAALLAAVALRDRHRRRQQRKTARARAQRAARQAARAANTDALNADTTPGTDTHLLDTCEALWAASRHNTRTEEM